MNLSYLLTLVSYLLFLFTPLLAIPLTDASPGHVAVPASNDAPFSTIHLPTHASKTKSGSRLKPRVYVGPSTTITFNSLTHQTRFTMFTAILPIRIAARYLNDIYFEIHFNLSPHGPWYGAPPMSRIIIQAKSIYLLFTATDPNLPVPWQLVKEWTLAMERLVDIGGFVGFYSASFQRLVGDKVIDYWVQTGIGTPNALGAAAA
ncbi:MAG: hypothetical protein Q9166_001442 [cf. Caloplaca sp. 2 TL-2023]